MATVTTLYHPLLYYSPSFPNLSSGSGDGKGGKKIDNDIKPLMDQARGNAAGSKYSDSLTFNYNVIRSNSFKEKVEDLKIFESYTTDVELKSKTPDNKPQTIKLTSFIKQTPIYHSFAGKSDNRVKEFQFFTIGTIGTLMIDNPELVLKRYSSDPQRLELFFIAYLIIERLYEKDSDINRKIINDYFNFLFNVPFDDISKKDSILLRLILSFPGAFKYLDRYVADRPSRKVILDPGVMLSWSAKFTLMNLKDDKRGINDKLTVSFIFMYSKDKRKKITPVAFERLEGVIDESSRDVLRGVRYLDSGDRSILSSIVDGFTLSIVNLLTPMFLNKEQLKSDTGDKSKGGIYRSVNHKDLSVNKLGSEINYWSGALKYYFDAYLPGVNFRVNSSPQEITKAEHFIIGRYIESFGRDVFAKYVGVPLMEKFASGSFYLDSSLVFLAKMGLLPFNNATAVFYGIANNQMSLAFAPDKRKYKRPVRKIANPTTEQASLSFKKQGGGKPQQGQGGQSGDRSGGRRNRGNRGGV